LFPLERFFNYKSNQKFWATFFNGHKLRITVEKIKLGWTIFFTNSSGHPAWNCKAEVGFLQQMLCMGKQVSYPGV
jgi:hypothetical protein